MSAYVTCVACSEENKLGSARCARCGALLRVTEGTVVDPELADFVIAQDEMAEKMRQQRLDRILRGIETTGEGLDQG